MLKTPTLTVASALTLSLFAAPVLAQEPPTRVGTTPKVEFQIDLERLPILDQGRSGTCWSFATTSFLESELARVSGKAVDLSEMHTVYWAYVERAQRYVRMHGNAQFAQGGVSRDPIFIAQKYGVVPAADFAGLPDGAKGFDHDELEGVLKAMVEKFANSKSLSPQWEQAVRAVLDVYIGAPPEAVATGDGAVSPQQYATEELKLPLDGYVDMMSYSYAPFGEQAELLVPDNWLRYQGYWNMPIEEMMANLDHALANGFTVAIACDVSERSNDRSTFKLGKDLEQGSITDEMRQKVFDNRETTDDHLMHIVGKGHAEDGQEYYLIKNSWGVRGDLKGHHLMTPNYLALKTTCLLVHRDGLLPATRATFEGEN